MIARVHLLHSAQRIELGRSDENGLHLVLASGRGLGVEVPPHWVSLWLPLRGEVRLDSRLSRWPLTASQWLLARDWPLQAEAQAQASWLVLAGSNAAWAPLLLSLPQRPTISELFPHQGRCPRALRRRFVHLARVARGPRRDAHSAAAALAFGQVLHEMQRDWQPYVDRCNGRTPHRRRLTLQRLLRVRQLVDRDLEGQLTLSDLARSANYSPWHLIRMYREVFGETPSEQAARLRLDRAWSLVRDSALPVCEITEALGFESQSAFCRAFKNAYGLTTTQARHLPPSAHARPIRTRARQRLELTRSA